MRLSTIIGRARRILGHAEVAQLTRVAYWLADRTWREGGGATRESYRRHHAAQALRNALVVEGRQRRYTAGGLSADEVLGVDPGADTRLAAAEVIHIARRIAPLAVAHAEGTLLQDLARQRGVSKSVIGERVSTERRALATWVAGRDPRRTGRYSFTRFNPDDPRHVALRSSVGRRDVPRDAQ